MSSVYRRDHVTWRQSQGYDQWGSPAGWTDTAILARVDWKTRLIRDYQGNEKISSGTLNVAPGHKPGIEDRYLIDGTEVSVIAIAPQKSFSKVMGYTVSFT